MRKPISITILTLSPSNTQVKLGCDVTFKYKCLHCGHTYRPEKGKDGRYETSWQYECIPGKHVFEVGFI